MPTSSWKRHFPILLYALALTVALTVTFVIWGAQGLIDNRADPYQFSVIGQSIAEGRGFTGFGSVLNRRAPLYPIFVGVLYWFFGVNAVLVKVVQALIFAGTCVLTSSIATRIFNARAGMIAGVMCAFHPSLLRYVADFHLETLFTFFVTLSVWCSVRFAQRPTFQAAAAFGISSGLAALTKAVVLLYPLAFAGALLLLTRSGASKRLSFDFPARGVRKLLLLGTAFAAMGLTIMPWTVRNYFATGGHFVLIGTGAGDAFLRGYAFSKLEYITLQKPPYEGAENEVNAMFVRICAEHGTAWTRDDLETDRILAQAAKERLLAAPLDFVRKFASGVFTFWYQMTSLKTSLAAGLLALAAWILAAIGLPRAQREGRPYWLVLVPVLFLNLQLAALLALGRYSVPILPCLIVLAAFGVETLLSRREQRSLAGAAA